jgi:hypothetical protein
MLITNCNPASHYPRKRSPTLSLISSHLIVIRVSVASKRSYISFIVCFLLRVYQDTNDPSELFFKWQVQFQRPPSDSLPAGAKRILAFAIGDLIHRLEVMV